MKEKAMQVLNLLRADSSITLNKMLLHGVGVDEAIVYCELVSRFFYFADNLTPDGYFFNTIIDLQKGTGLSGKRQRSAIRNLEKVGLLKTSLRGIPRKRYFKIETDIDVILAQISKGQEKVKQLEEKHWIANAIREVERNN